MTTTAVVMFCVRRHDLTIDVIFGNDLPCFGEGGGFQALIKATLMNGFDDDDQMRTDAFPSSAV
jgi:hypothetical protein